MTGPGPQKLIAGDLERGFYGEVPSSEIISGDELAELVGVTQGESQFSDTPWLKWAYKGKTLFRPKKAIRHSVTWGHLNEENLVYGDRIIEVNGLQYKIRLMRGISEEYEHAEEDLKKTAPNSEWNHLMLPIHEQAKDASWTYPEYVEDDVPYWGIDYTDKDLHTHSDYGSGTRVWCQESWGPESPRRVRRGGYGVSHADRYSLNAPGGEVRGWAPVLELLAPPKPPHKILIKKDGEYGYYDELEFVSLGAELPNEEMFGEYGMEDLSIFDTDEHEVVYPMTSDGSHHEMTLDLNSEHKHIIKLNEVTK